MKNKNIKKRIFITGASGFIGCNACEYFLKKGWEVFGLVKSGKTSKNVKVVKADLLNFEKLKDKVKKIKPSVILHLGAYVVLDRDFEVAKKCIDINIKGTLNLLEVARELSLSRFIFFSTEEVYGNNKPPYKEVQVVRPPSPYSVSKVAGENLCILYHDLYNLPIVVLRPATTFGFYQPLYRFIPNIIIRAVKNEPILLNSGQSKRDYLYIDNLMDAVYRIVNKQKAVGEIFNIGHGNSISGEKLARKVAKLSGSSSKIVLNSFPDRKKESKLWSMNSEKIEKLLGWKPEVSIDKNMEKTIKFYKDIQK